MATAKTQIKKKKVLIVDDHPIMRAGLVGLINQQDDLVVVGEAEDVAGALQAIEENKPDVVTVDISLKESNGLDLIKDIGVRWPKLAVLVLSMHEESFYAERVLRAGARGYVTKAEASAKVIEGLREVLKGQVYVGEKITARMLRKLVGGIRGLDVFPLDNLSDREFEIFELIGKGLQMREIAEKLSLSMKTVEAHREHIKRKLNIDNAAGLLKYAVQWVQFGRDAKVD